MVIDQVLPWISLEVTSRHRSQMIHERDRKWRAENNGRILRGENPDRGIRDCSGEKQRLYEEVPGRTKGSIRARKTAMPTSSKTFQAQNAYLSFELRAYWAQEAIPKAVDQWDNLPWPKLPIKPDRPASSFRDFDLSVIASWVVFGVLP